MSKQTAVEWLIEEMHKNIVFIPVPMQEKAKEMEMQQIMDAVNFGNAFNGWALKHEFKKYYNETYKDKEK
jgi:hypothetical protein